MFKRMMHRWMLLEGEGGDAPAGGAPAAAPAAEAAPVADAGLTPPESLLNDKPAEGEAKPEGEKKPDEAAKPEEPVKYEPFKLPEGVTLDEAKLGDFTKIAAEARIPQDVAQKMVDLYTSELKQLTEAPMRAWTELQNQWQNEVRNDPEIGGAKLDQNLAMIKNGLKNLLGEQSGKFFEALNVTGAGNNPDIVRGLFKAAQPHAPATPVSGKPGGSTKSPGATLYPGMAGLGNGHEG